MDMQSLSPIAAREQEREQRFEMVWSQELNEVFADVAPYYDQANMIASLGLWNWFRDQFVSTIALSPGQRTLDVCAGTNAIGIALLEREPTLEVHSIDRSADMQRVGAQRAGAKGFSIRSNIGDVHSLPFPDNHFDVVTLQYASRHLRIARVFDEIRRVLKPGGRFYHCDMLRPANPLVETLYYGYLRMCLAGTALVFRSGPAAVNCKRYFLDALQAFYTADELSGVMRKLDFREVASKSVFGGMIAFHRATKPRPA